MKKETAFAKWYRVYRERYPEMPGGDYFIARAAWQAALRDVAKAREALKEIVESEDSHIAFGASMASRVAHEQRRIAAFEAARALLGKL